MCISSSSSSSAELRADAAGVVGSSPGPSAEPHVAEPRDAASVAPRPNWDRRTQIRIAIRWKSLTERTPSVMVSQPSNFFHSHSNVKVKILRSLNLSLMTYGQPIIKCHSGNFKNPTRTGTRPFLPLLFNSL